MYYKTEVLFKDAPGREYEVLDVRTDDTYLMLYTRDDCVLAWHHDNIHSFTMVPFEDEGDE